MPVKFTFAAPFHHLISGAEVVYHKEGTLSEILSSLDNTYHGIKDILLKKDSLRDDIVILLNDKDIASYEGINTFIRDGDEVVILPVVAGG